MGGLVGQIFSGGMVTDAFTDRVGLYRLATGSASMLVGGIAGELYNGSGFASGGALSRVYSTAKMVGAFSRDSVLGGLVGRGIGSSYRVLDSFEHTDYQELTSYTRRGGLVGDQGSFMQHGSGSDVNNSFFVTPSNSLSPMVVVGQQAYPSELQRTSHDVYSKWNFYRLWEFVPEYDYPQLWGAVEPEPNGPAEVVCSPAYLGFGLGSLPSGRVLPRPSFINRGCERRGVGGSN